MSADNGIYILETIGPEYRVIHTQNIEDLDYDRDCNSFTTNDNVRIINAREVWKDSNFVHKTSDDAMKEAGQIYKEIIDGPCPILEYGISIIKINRKF